MPSSISPSIWAIVPAAGIGSRMRCATPKQYLPLLNNETVLDTTLAKLLSLADISGVVIALGEDDPYWQTSKYAQHEKVHTVVGGEERSDSVLGALRWCQQHSATENLWALVHDAARPCVTAEKIRQLIALCLADNPAIDEGFCGAILAAPVADTVKRVADRRITRTEDRRQLWLAHTPQMFPVPVLCEAILSAKAASIAVTDEASAIEAYGEEVLIVEDRRDNIKITVPEDLPWAQTILQQQGVKI